MTGLIHATISRIIKPDFQTGKLFWLSRTPDMFSHGRHGVEATCESWNKRYSGKEALTAINGSGYCTGKIFDRTYRAHRVIWLLHTGEWPEEDIDHINGDRSDNRIVNLRSVSHAVNGKNQRIRSTNTSGVQGVHWSNERRKWRAEIRVNGHRNHLGWFDDLASAASVRQSAEAKHGFHPNHGRVV